MWNMFPSFFRIVRGNHFFRLETTREVCFFEQTGCFAPGTPVRACRSSLPPVNLGPKVVFWKLTDHVENGVHIILANCFKKNSNYKFWYKCLPYLGWILLGSNPKKGPCETPHFLGRRACHDDTSLGKGPWLFVDDQRKLLSINPWVCCRWFMAYKIPENIMFLLGWCFELFPGVKYPSISTSDTFAWSQLPGKPSFK